MTLAAGSTGRWSLRSLLALHRPNSIASAAAANASALSTAARAPQVGEAASEHSCYRHVSQREGGGGVSVRAGGFGVGRVSRPTAGSPLYLESLAMQSEA